MEARSGKNDDSLGHQGGRRSGGLLAQTTVSGGGVQCPSYDGNGNIVAWTASNGTAPIARREYDDFGNTMIGEGTWPSSFGFSTKPQDTETGLYYYGYRLYNAEHGRWLNRDPLRERGGDNLYGFVKNNGMTSFDYLGLAKLTGTFSLLKQAETEYTPSTKVTNGSQLRQQAENQIGCYHPDGVNPCNCFDSLTIWSHGGVGAMELDGQVFGKDIESEIENARATAERLKDTTSPQLKVSQNGAATRARSLQETLDRLKSLGKLMCKGGRIIIYGCNIGGTLDAAGSTPSDEVATGEEFGKWLEESVFPGSEVLPFQPGYLVPTVLGPLNDKNLFTPMPDYGR